jgi:hypothetical protein
MEARMHIQTKYQYQIKSVQLIFAVALTLTFALSSTGCAVLSLKSLGLGSDLSDEEQALVDDPIAAAAARFRSPASSAALDSGASRERRYAVTRENVTFGMGMGEVAAIWGDPSDVQSAGDPREGNQKWTYFSGLSSRYGMGSRRVVYFENGRVAGWKNAQ